MFIINIIIIINYLFIYFLVCHCFFVWMKNRRNNLNDFIYSVKHTKEDFS